MTKQERIDTYKKVIEELRAEGKNKTADRLVEDLQKMMMEDEE
jgi:hypothetical protein